MQEVRAIVEEIEALEAVSHQVEVRAQVRESVGAIRSQSIIGGGTKAIRDPDLPIREAMGFHIRSQEDPCAAAPRAAVGEVAADAFLADRVEACVQPIEPDATEWCVRVVRNGRLGFVTRAGPSELAQPAEGFGIAADGVADAVDIGRRSLFYVVRERRDPQFVLEVVLVDQAALHAVEISSGESLDRPFTREEDAVLEEQRADACLLGEFEESILALRALQAIDLRLQCRLALETLFFDDDRQPEIDRQHDLPQWPLVFGDEVVERGHDSIASAAFELGIAHRRVHPIAEGDELAAIGEHAGPTPGLAVLLRDVFGLVVQVTATVGPAHVVQDQHGKGGTGRAAHVAKELELVVDGVPVVVAVDERRVHRWQVAEHVQTQIPVKDVTALETALVLARVEGGNGVDHVELDAGSEAIEHQLGVLASQRSDLDDALHISRLEEGRHHEFPERKHARSPCRSGPEPATLMAADQRSPAQDRRGLRASRSSRGQHIRRGRAVR